MAMLVYQRVNSSNSWRNILWMEEILHQWVGVFPII